MLRTFASCAIIWHHSTKISHWKPASKQCKLASPPPLTQVSTQTFIKTFIWFEKSNQQRFVSTHMVLMKACFDKQQPGIAVLHSDIPFYPIQEALTSYS